MTARAHHCKTGYHPVPSRVCRTWHKCDCPGCVEAERVYQRDYQRRWLGREPLADADATRARVWMLREWGWATETIAAAVGCAESTVRRVGSEDRRFVTERVRVGVERVWRQVMTDRMGRAA